MKFARTALAGGTASALAVAGLVTAQAALATPSPRVSVPCSASTLVSDINDNTTSGQTFLLAHRCTYILTTGDALTIPTDLTIRGDGATIERSTLAADFRLITVTTDVDLVLDDVNLANGYASGSNGGAIDNEDGDVTLNGGTLSGNTATEDGDNVLTGRGGAIYSAAELTVNHTTFADNSANVGGALDNEDTATVIGATFTGNTSADDGGAFNIWGGTTLVRNSTFDHNTAVQFGGGIYAAGTGTITVDRTSFRKDSAGTTGSYGGGGIFNQMSETSYLRDDSIRDCTAEQGGGLLIYSDAPTTINGGDFSHDTASDGAGFSNDGGTATLVGVRFDANKATDAGSGGGIYNYNGGDTTLNDGDSFTVNTAATGAGLYNADESTVSHAQFSHNSASADGGAIYNAAAATVTIGHSRITGNSAGADGGGGIYNAGTDVAVTLTDSQVTHNDPDNCAPTASVTGCTG